MCGTVLTLGSSVLFIFNTWTNKKKNGGKWSQTALKNKMNRVQLELKLNPENEHQSADEPGRLIMSYSINLAATRRGR